jgi:hypothetical protein
MHPINYALGLVAELEGAIRGAYKEREAAVRAELAWAADELAKVDVTALDADATKLHGEATAAIADALAKPKRAAKAAEPTA